MKFIKPNLSLLAIVGLVLLGFVVVPAPVFSADAAKSKDAKQAPKEGAEDESPAADEEVEVAEVPDNSDVLARHKSVFEPRPGSDPFYPQRKVVASNEAKAAPAANIYDRISVKGISGSASKRIAIINNKNVEAGDTATITTSEGLVSIKVLEVKENSVVIKAETASEPKELFLRRF